jgi:hypothetical protein
MDVPPDQQLHRNRLAIGQVRPDEVRERFGHRPPAPLADAQGGFRGPLLGHVPEDKDDADRLALFVLDRGSAIVDGPFHGRF